MAWRYSNDPDLVAKRSMDRVTFAYLDVDGRIDLISFFFGVSLCICIFGFIKSRMLNHKIDF